MPTPTLNPTNEREARRISCRPAHGSDEAVYLDGLRLKADAFLEMDFDWPLTELIEGEVVMAPAPHDRHQRSSFNLGLSLGNYVVKHAGGVMQAAPSDLLVNDETVTQPDLIWFGPNHPRISNMSASEQTPPNLVLEILSPGNTRHDLVTKRRLYAKAGIPFYWIADPMAKTIMALGLKDGEYQEIGATEAGIFKAAPFGDLAINLAEIFPWPDE